MNASIIFFGRRRTCAEIVHSRHIAAIAIATWVTACAPAPGLNVEQEKKLNREKFESQGHFLATVRRSDHITIYEGLPHQVTEREILMEERNAKQTFEYLGYQFYFAALELKDGDLAVLQEFFSDRTKFSPRLGAKACGAFHPDFYIEWRLDRDTYHCLICLGCSEVKLYGPNCDLHCDLSEGLMNGLQSLFSNYRKNRPLTERNSWWAK